ncbi:MAG TPA: endonuclease/exonuclease/phosphatase family protein [Gaiellaceae bacterium]|nr:endonuclease/exonuclease/phosphatase family protein [Gaiellaceae bacterium]
MLARCVAVAVLAAAFTVGAVAVAPSSGGTTARPTPLSTLKLLQFNVREGATGSRGAAVAAVIKSSHADVITLDEVNVKSVFQQLARSTRFHSYYVQSRDGYNVGILSRYPIARCYSYTSPPLHHGAYGCRIPIAGTNWWVFGAHLCPCSLESDRALEASYLISQMKLHARDRVVLAGDLNAQTPGENSKTPLLVIPLLKANGYIDAFREMYSVEEAPGFTITPPPYGQWERRIDYVFHSRNARATAARVISSVTGYTWPSDHAALAVTLVNRPALVAAG